MQLRGRRVLITGAAAAHEQGGSVDAVMNVAGIAAAAVTS